jgi:hypothetical protein
LCRRNCVAPSMSAFLWDLSGVSWDDFRSCVLFLWAGCIHNYCNYWFGDVSWIFT